MFNKKRKPEELDNWPEKSGFRDLPDGDKEFVYGRQARNEHWNANVDIIGNRVAKGEMSPDDAGEFLEKKKKKLGMPSDTENPYKACSLFTLSSIIGENLNSHRFRDLYKSLANLGKDEIIKHTQNRFGVFYLDYVLRQAQSPSQGLCSLVEGPVYGAARDIAFGQFGNAKNPHPNLIGQIVTYLITVPFQGIREAALDARVDYLLNHLEITNQLRDVAKGHANKGDARDQSFIKATTTDNLVKLKEGQGKRHGIIYSLAHAYQNYKNSKRQYYAN